MYSIITTREVHTLRYAVPNNELLETLDKLKTLQNTDNIPFDSKLDSIVITDRLVMTDHEAHELMAETNSRLLGR